MADSLFGSIAPEDRNLGLLAMGLSLLAGNRGMNRRDAMANALGSAAHGGIGILGPIMQSQQLRATEADRKAQRGLQERGVVVQEMLAKDSDEMKKLQVEQLRNQMAIRNSLFGGGGAQMPGPDGTQITPMPTPGVQSSPLSPGAPMIGPGAQPGALSNQSGLSLDKLRAAYAGGLDINPLVKMFELGQPQVDFVHGVPVDKRTAQLIPGAPSIPTISQSGQAMQMVPDRNAPGGFRMISPTGALDILTAQEEAKQRANARFGRPVEVQLPTGQTQLVTPERFSDMSNADMPLRPDVNQKIPPGYQAGKDKAALDLLQAERARMVALGEDPSPVDVVIREYQRKASPTGAAPGGGLLSGKTTQQTQEEQRQAVGAKAVTESDEKRVTDLETKLPSLQRTVRRLDELVRLTNDDTTYANSGAKIKTELNNIAQSLGLSVNKDKTANSELYISHVAELVKDRLGSKDYGSGSGVSNLDLLTAEKPLPEIAKTTEGRKRIIAAIKADTQLSIEDAVAARNYFDTNNYSLRGFRYPSEVAKEQTKQPRDRSSILKQYGIQ